MGKYIKSILAIVLCAVAVFVVLQITPNDNTASNVKQQNEQYVLSWNSHPTATEYDVYVNDTLVDTVSATSMDITSYLIDDKTYELEIKVDGAVGDEVVYSENYKYQAESKADFMRKTFFMYGDVYDYNIETLDEYKIFVWYNILYRNSGVRFYNSCTELTKFNVNQKTFDYILEYPEYDGLNSRNVYASSVNSKIFRISNWDYYLPKDFTLRSVTCPVTEDSGLYGYVIRENATQATKASIFFQPYEAMPTASERHFPIDTGDIQEVVVYNTEQLFMVAQYGARPIFHETATVAETCYNNAKTILRQINNSDELTDYQKVLNIYRYICMNVKYDNVLTDYMDSIGNHTVNRFGKFSCFYMEGALYDLNNQVAVCDGLSKTFALLCRIEGIEATKVNGIGGGGEHAWNKVRLGDNYHLVDTTWGSRSYNLSGVDYEALAHEFFLTAEDEYHETTFEVETPAPIDYGYYEKTSKVGPLSGYVTSDSDLTAIKNYITANSVQGFEIRLSDEYLDSITAKGYYGREIGTYINTKLGSATKQWMSLSDGGPVILVQNKYTIAG